VRIRSIVSFSTGAVLGAGAVYLLDPDHGPDRRRDARGQAVRRARGGATSALVDGRRRAEELVLAAVRGFEQGRTASQQARARHGLRVVTDDGRQVG
jgi:hypothetical protein